MGYIVVEGHEQLGAQQAVARLIGAYIQPLTLLELAHAQIHHGRVHLHRHMLSSALKYATEDMA